MEFIKVEEFLKQPIEIQKVFMDWWKCDNGDLYVDNKEYEADKIYFDVNCVNMNLEGDIEGDWEYFKTISTPIFTEGQLRRFIEDILVGKLDIQFCEGTYNFYLFEEVHDEEFGFDQKNKRRFEKLTNNVLQSYWKVAIEIAKEVK